MTERLELNTLKNYVDWTKLGIGTVYTANNGLQALETAEFKKPDIVFTDIRMPGYGWNRICKTTEGKG